jgi:hypothetical protein
METERLLVYAGSFSHTTNPPSPSPLQHIMLASFRTTLPPHDHPKILSLSTVPVQYKSCNLYKDSVRA